ncbi:MAG: histidine kinase [Proteobacteria bacterium]|nr:histidine kinase [Pseudomonadota bacterium]
MRAILLVLLMATSWPGVVRATDVATMAGPAPTAEFGFRTFGSDRPFQAEIITEVMFDRIGFMWIGTREGLYLYDGQRFRKFQHEVQNPESLSSNGIRGVFEDNRGRLWVNTISGGLNLLDRATWRFHNWRHQRNDPESIAHDGVFALADAPDGRLWVGTQAGLDLFDPDTGKFAHQILATGGEFVIALLKARDGRLWAATLGQGLFRQRVDGSGFDPVPGTGRAAPLDIFSLAQAADGTIWVGARDGLYRVESATGGIVPSGLASVGTADKLNMVTALLSGNDGGLWIGTFGNGLYRLEPNASGAVRVMLGPDGTGAQQIDSGAMALDRDGNLFVGTFGAGMWRTGARVAGLQSWQTAQGHRPGLAALDVYALRVQPARTPDKDRLLVGSFGGGIDEIALADGAVTHATLPVPEALNQHLGGITDLLLTREGEIWATTNEGVFRWNRGSGYFHYYPPGQPASASTNPDYSFSLLQDRRGRIWVGSAGGGLYLYQPDSDTFRNFRPRRAAPHSLPDDFVTDLIEDRRGRLWVATRSGGIGVCRYDGDLDCLHIVAGNAAQQISHDQVTALLEARDDAVWAATAGGGLDRLVVDASDDVASVQRWTHDEGLDDDNVMAMVYGPDDALWFTTHGGVSRLDLATHQVTNLAPADGLPTAIFNPKAAVVYGRRLYFGSAKGVVSIDPQQVPRRGAAPPTVVEAVSGLDAVHMPTRPAWQLASLSVPWRTPFSLEFAVLGYDAGSPRFQYRLRHADAWTELGDRAQLTLHALEPGRHRLEVRGRRAGYDWTLAPPLVLDIVPPWWRKPATQIAAAALLLMVLLGGFYWRVRELHMRNRALRHMTMRLEAAKEDERRHLARELHDEFGQALTSAKINLGLALARPPSTDGAARISDTIAVIDGLLGQVRALSLDLRPPLLDEMGLVPALEGYLNAVSARSGLVLRQRLDAQAEWVALDREITVFRIVQEAVTNAVRHAGARTLDVSLIARDGGVAISVRDDGKGFDAGTTLAAGGPGLGLFGMRERALDLGGSWAVESGPGRGTLVTAFVPAQAAVNR